MRGSNGGSGDLPLQLGQIRHILERDFTDLIDLSDFENKQPQEREQAWCSRALAALVVRRMTGFENEEAAACVIDGRDDQGIDAVAVSEAAGRIWLVQSKWSDKGRAGFGKAEALKFVEGLNQLENRNFDRFNERVRSMAGRISSVLTDPNMTIHLVIAIMGTGELSDEVRQVFEDRRAEMNRYGPTLDYEVLNARSIWQQIRVEEAPAQVEIETELRQWIHVQTPVEIYQGIARATEIASWFDKAGTHLFQQNIRDDLGITTVNEGIARTLSEEPDYFLCFHNGITVICEYLTTSFPRRRRPDEPVQLTLRGASVVNGAQSVSAIHRAMREHPDQLEDADVSLHIICVGGENPELPGRITETRNKQNQVEDRDFVALDEVQSRIREDFAIRLEKTYTYKRGEPDPAPDSGCSVEQAAVALACAHPNPKLVVRAKQNVATLWERGAGGAYELLFSEQPTAPQIWGALRLQRAVMSSLHKAATKYRGRAADLAERGDLLTAHIVFQLLGGAGIDDDYDWDSAVAKAPGLTDTAFRWLLYHLDREFGTESRVSLPRILADEPRCRALVKSVLADAHSRAREVPTLAEDYRRQRQQKARRPNSVSLLLDDGRISEGTVLTYQPKHPKEREALRRWLEQDPRRGRATWVKSRRSPLLWEYDNQRYSPSRLTMRMYELAEWEDAPVAVQGPSRWFVNETSLAELAERILRDVAES